MKIAAHQFAGTLANVSAWAGILLHGDDWGIVRDRSSAACVAVLGAATDPFRLSVLVREEHGRLSGEVGSIALGGGRRVIRVPDASDGLAGVIEKLADYRTDALVVLESAALTPRSKLRTLAEKHPLWAAVACYPERAGAVEVEISRMLHAAKLSVEPDALAYLAAELSGESTRRRAEVEKVALYAMDDGRVTLAAAVACCAVETEASLAAAVTAALDSQPAVCDALLEELHHDGATGAGVLAVLSNQVHRLLRMRAQMNAGASAEAAARRLQPPVFPSQLPGLLRQVQAWPYDALIALGRALREADMACKRAGSADMTIAARLLSAIANRRERRG